MTGKTVKNETSLSELLRALYLHDVEFCLLMSREEEDPPVFTKDQIISVLERDAGEKSAWELTGLCSFYSTLETLLKKKVLNERTEVFVIQEEDSGILPVSSLRDREETGETTEDGDAPPSWWGAPVPFVSWKKGTFLSNGAASELLMGAEVKKGRGGEFIRELADGRCMLFRKVHPAVYFVEDVSEDLGKAREMAWWAAVGRACVGSFEKKGCRAERVSETSSVPEDGTVEFLKCLWDGEELGYLRLSHGKKS